MSNLWDLFAMADPMDLDGSFRLTGKKMESSMQNFKMEKFYLVISQGFLVLYREVIQLINLEQVVAFDKKWNAISGKLENGTFLTDAAKLTVKRIGDHDCVKVLDLETAKRGKSLKGRNFRLPVFIRVLRETGRILIR